MIHKKILLLTGLRSDWFFWDERKLVFSFFYFISEYWWFCVCHHSSFCL